MSKYTTELRYLCEKAAGLNASENYNSVSKIISAAIPKIFSFDFPMFDENYRAVLCAKILRHYYTREICEETPGLWKLRLETRLNEIMPYFNQLYKSELLEYEPLNDTDVKTRRDLTNKTDTTNESERGTDDVTSDTNNSTGNIAEKNLFSNTPQGALTGVETGEYLTDARKINSEVTQNDTRNIDRAVTETESASGSIDTTENYVMHVVGKSGGNSYSQLVKEFRETFLNIDMEVIKALEDLFMCVW